MQLSIGNAPCSWGVEFADDPRNPPWIKVLDETREAGYRGIELGPLGYMPEDSKTLTPALAARGLSLIGGVMFRPFHDPAQWDKVREDTYRTCRTLVAHGARQLVFIDSIAARRAPTAGRPQEAERLKGAERSSFIERLRTAARIGAEEFGLTVSMHAHAAGFCEFEDEIEELLDEIKPELMGVCLDTGHSTYAGYDPTAFYRRHRERVHYIHFKDVNPEVLRSAIANRTGFYDACAAGIFCTLGDGCVDFAAFKRALQEGGFSGWGTVEQDRDPKGARSTLTDATANLNYLKSVGLA